jgi:hypothetical protein
MARKLMHDHLAAGANEADRRREPGKTGAHDMHGSTGHQTMP